jgi:hypothetical protein
MNVQLQHQISNYISVNSNRSVFSAVQTNSNAVYGTRLLHSMWHWGIHYNFLCSPDKNPRLDDAVGQGTCI